MSAGRLRVQVLSGPPFSLSVAQSSQRAAWAREVAGENPAVPTHFNSLPWSNTSGIRLLNGTMQAEVLPQRQFNLQLFEMLGGVKVARRFVKPHGAGASPALAANFRKAGRYKLAAPVSKSGMPLFAMFSHNVQMLICSMGKGV